MATVIVGVLTLVVAAIGTASTLLFRLRHERAARRNELLKWVERALSLIGAWKWRGRMVGTEYELDRVIAETDSALTLARKLRLSAVTEEIREVTNGLTQLRGKQGWDAELGDSVVERLDGVKKTLASLNTWWPLW